MKALLTYSHKRWLNLPHDSLFQTGVQIYELAEKTGSSFYKSFGLRNQVFARLYGRDYKSCEVLLHKKMIIDSVRGNTWWIAMNYMLLTEVKMFTQQHDIALEYIERSLHLWEDMGNKNKMAFASNYKGMIYGRQGDYRKALEWFNKAVGFALEIDKETEVEIFKVNAAQILAKQGHFDTAINILNEGLKVQERNHHNTYIAMTSDMLGDVLTMRGDYDEARKYYHQFIEIYQTRQMPDLVAETNIKIGNNLVDQGRYTEAFDLLKESLRTLESMGLIEKEALALSCFGLLNFRLANYRESLSYYNQSLAIFDSAGLKENIANVFVSMGEVYHKQQRLPESLILYQKALDIYLDLENKSKKADVYRNMAMNYRSRGNIDTSFVLLEKSKDLYQEIGSLKGLAEIYSDFGELYLERNEIEKGLEWCSRGYEEAHRMGLQELERKASYCLYRAHKSKGNGMKALQYYEVYLALSDSLNTSDAEQMVHRMELENKFRADSLALAENQLETEIAFEKSLLKEKQNRNAILSVGIVILILSGGLLSRIIFIRKTNRELAEKNSLIEKAKRQAEESERAKEQFFDNISHELRTPLTLIKGPLEEVIDNTDDQEIKHGLEIIKRNVSQLHGLINELLDLSKLEFGKVRLQVRPVDIVKATEEYLLAFESLADQKDIQLIFKSSRSSIKIPLDLEKYHKILANLLSNAFKFTAVGGEIKVSLNSTHIKTNLDKTGSPDGQNPEPLEHKGVVIKVSDSGSGIPEDKLSHIFDRFYQVDEGMAVNPGSGIGLALTKELIELHHGHIQVRSNPGKGTVFTIILPAVKEAFTEEEILDVVQENKGNHKQWVIERAISGHVPSNTGQGEKEPEIILVIDDNPDMRSYIKNTLSGEYTIIQAGNGESGLRKAIEEIPTLVISDVMMPIMDGYELTRELKSDPRTSHIPVILLTARASIDHKVTGFEMGADAYLTKPFDTKELRVRVKNLIQQRRKIREHFKTTLESEHEFLIKDPQLKSLDRQFLEKALEIVRMHITDSNFEAKLFASEMALSRMQLHRKIKALTNKSTTEFIRTVRLNHAASLLRKKTDNITQIAFASGFESPSWFSKNFKSQFGMSPSEYMKKNS